MYFSNPGRVCTVCTVQLCNTFLKNLIVRESSFWQYVWGNLSLSAKYSLETRSRYAMASFNNGLFFFFKYYAHHQAYCHLELLKTSVTFSQTQQQHTFQNIFQPTSTCISGVSKYWGRGVRGDSCALSICSGSHTSLSVPPPEQRHLSNICLCGSPSQDYDQVSFKPSFVLVFLSHCSCTLCLELMTRC